MTPQRILLGMTGASGVSYGQRVLDLLDQAGVATDVIVSEAGRGVLLEELSVTELSAPGLLDRNSERVTFHDNNNLFSAPASGSSLYEAMIVCPCSMNSLSGIATGRADTLLFRAAAVTLKQHRPLILVPREMPLSQIDIENMLRVSQAGGILCPACPGFYHNPETPADLVDFVAGRVLDLLNIPHQLSIRWYPNPS